MSKRWIISGANGYLGGGLCLGLQRRAEDVLGLIRQAESPPSLSEAGIPCRNYADLPEVVTSGDVFVHCAGKVGTTGSWAEFQRVNVDWPATLFDQAAGRGAACFVQVSSVAALGYRNRPGQEELDETSASRLTEGELYGRSKLLGEQALLERAQDTQTRMVILRPGLIYGHRPMTSAQTWLRRGIVVDPGQRLPLVQLDNFLDAVVRTATEAQAQGIFLVVDEEQPRLRELNDLRLRYGLLRYHPWLVGKPGFWGLTGLRKVLNTLRGRGGDLPRGHARAQYDFATRRLLYSTDRLRSVTGWAPQVDLQHGLAECADH